MEDKKKTEIAKFISNMLKDTTEDKLIDIDQILRAAREKGFDDTEVADMLVNLVCEGEIFEIRKFQYSKYNRYGYNKNSF